MRLPTRSLSDAALLAAHREAQASLAGFMRATQAQGSLIRCWTGGAAAVALEHYPGEGVIDHRCGAQFYYHCHRDADAEHGHLHLFWHATRGGRRRRIRPRDATDPWRRSAPSHLVSIGLDARGLPITLFTVNRWVTGGYWFDAGTTLAMVRRFEPALGGTQADACAWLSAFVRLYLPLIGRLLRARDRALARRGGGKAEAAIDDRGIEVTSHARLHWSDDLQRLDDEVAARRLAPRAS